MWDPDKKEDRGYLRISDRPQMMNFTEDMKFRLVHIYFPLVILDDSWFLRSEFWKKLCEDASKRPKSVKPPQLHDRVRIEM